MSDSYSMIIEISLKKNFLAIDILADFQLDISLDAGSLDSIADESIGKDFDLVGDMYRCSSTI
jgi:hypothetical protein